VLRLEELDAPEDLDVITPLARGNLLHDILREFIETSPALEPRQRWSDADHERLRVIARRRCDEEAATGFAGRPLVWELERRRLLLELAATLDADNGVRADYGVVPEAVEMGFGLPDDSTPAVRFLTSGGRPISFKGRIDRVDRTPAGDRLGVWDYKTGKAHRFKITDADPLVRGTRLQLAVYGLAARARWGEDLPVDVGYWFTSPDEHSVIAGYELTADILDELAQVLDTMVAGILAGVFPARPGPDQFTAFENCRTCPFDRVCPTDRDRVWSRVRADPRVARYVALAEPAVEAR
jgi:RecB family exonuclease